MGACHTGRRKFPSRVSHSVARFWLPDQLSHIKPQKICWRDDKNDAFSHETRREMQRQQLDNPAAALSEQYR
jgi:hypothetical protein